MALTATWLFNTVSTICWVGRVQMEEFFQRCLNINYHVNTSENYRLGPKKLVLGRPMFLLFLFGGWAPPKKPHGRWQETQLWPPKIRASWLFFPKKKNVGMLDERNWHKAMVILKEMGSKVWCFSFHVAKFRLVYGIRYTCHWKVQPVQLADLIEVKSWPLGGQS